MDGRGIIACPWPCSGRRVVAKKQPRCGRDGFVNSVKQFQKRGISSKRDSAFRMSDAQEQFRNIRLQGFNQYIGNVLLLTGKCLAKTKPSNRFLLDDCTSSGNCGGENCNSRKQARGSKIRSTVAEAPEDATVLFYDEERNEIPTGNIGFAWCMCGLTS